jgi:hypothetical protein
MTTRYCPSCRAEVEDTGGFCLLGHNLTLEAPTSSLSELRAEVDRVFEEAQVEVAAAMSAPPPPPPAETVRAAVSGASPAPSPPRRVFEGLGTEPARPQDPISAFAPPPRMDWGPEGRLARLLSRSVAE